MGTNASGQRRLRPRGPLRIVASLGPTVALLKLGVSFARKPSGRHRELPTHGPGGSRVGHLQLASRMLSRRPAHSSSLRVCLLCLYGASARDLALTDICILVFCYRRTEHVLQVLHSVVYATASNSFSYLQYISNVMFIACHVYLCVRCLYAHMMTLGLS